MLRRYVYGVFPKNYKIIAEERFYERLYDNDILNELWQRRGIEIYPDNEHYIIDVYMVIDDIEYFYSECVENITRRTINEIVDYFVDRLLENEDYYLALHTGVPIQIN